MSSNEYNDMSVFNAIDNANIILPDIQREYCWTTKDVEELFYSIIKDFPIGSFIIWKTNGTNLNSSSSIFYKFLNEARYKKKREVMISRNDELKRNFKSEDYYVVLDGQQRLTSFMLVFKGKFYIKKNGSTGSDEKLNNFVEKELYYNLNNYDESPEGGVNPFVFLNEEEKNDGNYYSISSMLEFKGQNKKFYNDLDNKTKGYDERVSNDLEILFERLNKEEKGNSLIHYYTILSDRYDDALDVFVKVNSSGKPLNKTDLLFGTLINGWEKDINKKEGRRKEIENYISGTNDKYGFDIDKDFLLRTVYILTNEGKSVLSMQEICKKDVIDKMRRSWKKVTKSICKTFQYLNEININDARILSYNAIIPIMYYVHLGGKFKTSYSRDELKKYFAISFAKGLFGGSSNQAIENTCKDIEKNYKTKDFNISYFKDTDFSGGRSFNVDINNINDWIAKYEKGKKTYVLLMLVSPNLNLLEENYDQDHSHAESLFNEKKMKKNKIDIKKLDSWREKRNLLPNLSFMISSGNRSKNDDDLDTWISNNPDKRSSLRCLPQDIDYSFKNFEQFFVLRRSMMKFALTDSFGVNKEKINVGNSVTLNVVPKEHSHLSVGMHGKVVNIDKNEIAKVEFYNKDNISKGIYDIDLNSLYIVEEF